MFTGLITYWYHAPFPLPTRLCVCVLDAHLIIKTFQQLQFLNALALSSPGTRNTLTTNTLAYSYCVVIINKLVSFE